MPKTALFGEFVSSEVPAGFVSVASFRDVPDNQEVFVNLENQQFEPQDSILFELLEAVDAPTDQEALKVHINELLTLNESDPAQWHLVTGETVVLDHFDNAGQIGYAVAPVEKLRTKEWLYIVAGVVRHKAKSTDVLVTMNLPVKFEGGSAKEVCDSIKNTDRVRSATEAVLSGMKAFKVEDESLFG